MALATNGGFASASSSTPASDGAGNYEPLAAINGERLAVGTGDSYSNNTFWRDGTGDAFPDWLQVKFNGTKLINEIDVYSLQDNYHNPIEPTANTTFSLYGITSFDVQYWNGSAWMTVPGGSVTGNNKVWRKFTFSNIATSKIRVMVNNALASRSRIVELEAYGIALPTNVALATNGGFASASSSTPASDGAGNYEPLAAINGERLAVGTGDSYSNNTFWRDGTGDAFPDWLQVEFDGTKTINEIDVYTLQDNYHNPIEPTANTTFSLYGITSFDVQYWNGSAWATVTGGSVSGNNKVWRQFTFSPLSTNKIRVVVNNALASRSRIVELEAYEPGASPSSEPTQNLTAEARLDPVNRTGGSGEDLLSGNYNWTLPLLNLPGRAGLDLSLSLSYNSLVWTRAGQTITYDADQGFPSPGFQLGFPRIEPLFFNTQTGRNTYLLITPSGGRVELRQSSTQPNLYESADSSYLQLDASLMILRTTDGTRLKYESSGGAYHCTEVKERNGNFITITYVENTDDINEIIDTLGRKIKFNYENGYPVTITQEPSLTGQPATVLASFGYNSNYAFQTNFVNESGAALTMFGRQNNAPFPVLKMVGLPDGSYFKFAYSSWGQVSRITRFGSDSNPDLDNHPLSYVSYNLANDATARSSCPRFTERRDWAENWNSNAEALTLFSIALSNTVGTVTLPTVTYTTPPGIPSTSTSVMSKQYFGTGVQKGLLTKVETYANGELVRTSETIWTQDKKPDGSEYTYQVNPRPIETKISDPWGNVRGTIIDYGQYDAYGLPFDVSEYVGAEKTILRRTRTYYNLAAAYTDRRIIGLVSARLVYDRDGALSSQVEYLYDLNLNQEYLQNQGTAIQHDGANYPASFVEGRGNLTRIVRWNVFAPGNQALVLESRIGYNTTGSVIFTRDPLGHQSTIGYTDSFSTAVNLAYPTFAYPTSFTDADAKTSTAKYDYQLGAISERSDPKGLVIKTLYDTAGRVDRIYNSYNNAFRQWHYGAGYVVTYTSVKNLTETLYEVKTFDGLGQVIGAAQQTSAPGGADPHYSGKRFAYDVMGRLEYESNPTEMAGGWAAAGDDLLQASGEGGWRYSQQTYDWKGRPLVTINQDGSTKVASYGGCGCAGGEVVTIQGEKLAEGRRTQKLYHDALGRPVKSEVYNWDNTTVYSTTTTEYNARDQVLFVKEYQEQAASDGSCPSGTCQQTAMTYDGYGRLATRKLPQQSTATTYSYYADDLLQSVTDARGATATYGHNGRHQVTAIAYRLAGSPNIDVSYGYDSVGNRTSMSDANGVSEYHYDQLSRMDWEKRTVYGVTGANNIFQISYGYDLGGDLTSITDPFNATVSYARDHTGRITSVNGSGFNEVLDTPGGQEVTQYASNFTYRAWGALKHLSYSQGLELNLTYDKRLQLRQYEVAPVTVVNGNEVKIKNQYDYYADGRMRFIADMYEHKFDRSYSYDHIGRLTAANTSNQARGEQPGPLGPYQQTYQYDAFNHMTSRSTKHWSQNFSYSTSYVNNKDQQYGLVYDNEGNLVVDSSGKTHTYDAAGDHVMVTDGSMSVAQGYDGNHLQVKRVETVTDPASTTLTYSLRSSMLGGAVLTELYSDGTKHKTNVYADGQLIATQSIGKELNGYGLITQSVLIHHEEPFTGNERDSWKQFGTVGEPTQLDPMGVDAWTRNKYLEVGEPERDWPRFMHGTMSQPGSGCSVDGVPSSCDYAAQIVQMGAGEILAVGTDTSPRRVVERDSHGRVSVSWRQLVATQYGLAYSYSTYTQSSNVTADPDYPGQIGVEGNRSFRRVTVFRTIGGQSQGQMRAWVNLGGFRGGAHARFTATEIKRLQDSYNRINMQDCKNWINAKLSDLNAKPGKNTLDDLLKIANFSKYSSKYSAADMGISQKDRDEIYNKYDKNIGRFSYTGPIALAVTLSDRKQVYLMDEIFETESFFGGGTNRDTAGRIVHELFHVAGFDDPLVDSLNGAIHDYCGLPGTNF